jgi:hypothetical protein
LTLSILTKLRVRRPENLKFDFRPKKEILLFSDVPRPTLRLTTPPIEWARRICDWGVRQTTHFCVEPKLRMPGGIPPIPVRVHDVVLN